MRPKDYIDKKAKEEALKAFGATQLNNNQETSPYFVGKISADRKKITDPTGREYDLIFTGNPKQYELAQRLSDSKAVVNAQVGAKMNVDGGKSLKFVYNGPLDSDYRIKFIYVYDSQKQKLFSLPTTVLGFSTIFGGSLEEIQHKEAQIGLSVAPMQAVSFINGGKDLFVYTLVTNLNTPNIFAGDFNISNAPIEFLWTVIRGITLKSTQNTSDTDFISYEINYSSLEHGSYIADVSNFSITSAAAVPSSSPPNYSLVNTVPGAAYSTFFQNLHYNQGGGTFNVITPQVSFENDEIFILLGVGSFSSTDSFIYESPPDEPPIFYHPNFITDTGFAISENLFLINATIGSVNKICDYTVNYNSAWQVTTVISPNPTPRTDITTSSIPNNTYNGVPIGITFPAANNRSLEDFIDGQERSLLGLFSQFAYSDRRVILSRAYFYTETIDFTVNYFYRTDEFIYEGSTQIYSSGALARLLVAPFTENYASPQMICANSKNIFYTFSIFGATELPNPNFAAFKDLGNGRVLCLFSTNANDPNEESRLYMITLKVPPSNDNLGIITSPDDVLVKVIKPKDTGVFNLVPYGNTYLIGGFALYSREHEPLNTSFIFGNLAAGKSRTVGTVSSYGDYIYK